MPTWIVECTPGPPAIGTLTKKEIVAESGDAAYEYVKRQHNWVMIHKVYEKAPEPLLPEKAYLQERLEKVVLNK